MVDGSGGDMKLVLIDFDGCRPIGASLTATEARRTHGWYDPSMTTSLASNDLDTLAEVRASLLWAG